VIKKEKRFRVFLVTSRIQFVLQWMWEGLFFCFFSWDLSLLHYIGCDNYLFLLRETSVCFNMAMDSTTQQGSDGGCFKQDGARGSLVALILQKMQQAN
jgi:hypothetical protein